MAIGGKNSGDGFTGKRGRFTYYYLNGKLISRTIGVRTLESTPALEATWQANSLVTAFLKPIKEFTDLGFELEAKKEHSYKYSRAYSCVRTQAIVGVYPDQAIDFSRVLVSRGKMKMATDVKAELKGNSIVFSWDTTLTPRITLANDQVMLMAYFPETLEAEYIIQGGTRGNGTAELVLPAYRNPVVMETYLTFISANHKSISNSTYTGQLTLPGSGTRKTKINKV